MHTKHLCVLIHIGIKGEIGTVDTFKSSSNFLTDCSKAVLLVDPFCYLCFVFARLHCLLISALLSPAGIRLTLWPSCK